MTDIVRQLSALQLDGGLLATVSEEGDGLREPPVPPPDLTQLPNTAVHSIFSSLDAVDKHNLFRASKSVRELFAHHLCSISVSLPCDEEYIRGYGSLPRTLTGLPPTMHNMSIRITRKFFNACHGNRLFASGEPLPHSQLALMDFIGPVRQSTRGEPEQLLAKASQIELQGYCLTTPVALRLAAHCQACSQVKLSNVDVRGPFFRELASLRSCSHLELNQVHLLDIDAHASLSALSAMLNLRTLVLVRVMHISVNPNAGSHSARTIDGSVPTPLQVATSQITVGNPCRHPDCGCLSQLPGLQHFKIQLAEGLTQTPSAAQFMRLAGSCHQLSSLAILGLEGLQYLSNTDLAPLVSGCATSLKSLQFDQHVVVTGVQALLQMKQLEHVCARSLEPRPYQCFANVVHCSLRSLSLGGCCPSVSALAALPLHSLTHHLDVTKLDLAPLSQGDPVTMADALGAAVRNMARCPSLRIMGGKLELSGRPMPIDPPPPPLPPQASQPAGYTGLVTAVAPLLALEPLAYKGVTHLKLSGFALTAQHIQALADAVGTRLSALTFADCSLDASTLRSLTSSQGFLPSLHQVSFARYVIGVDLRLLTDILCSPDAAALQVFLLYQLGFESTPEEGLVASDASVGEAMQAIIAVHGFGHIQLHVRWSL